MVTTIGLLLLVVGGTCMAGAAGFFVGMLVVGLIWPEGELGILAWANAIGIVCMVVAFLGLFSWAVNYG